MTPKKRIAKLMTTLAGLLAAGLAYAAFVSMTGLALPCLFHAVTGLKCPGCGVTRMCMALLRLDFDGAWRANPAIMALLPLGAAVAADLGWRYIKNGGGSDRFCNISLWAMIAVMLVFGAVRNMV